jgi:uncharacterized membrane protein YoaK (UPF0700 family)
MIHVDAKDLYKTEYALLWCILSFKAGFLNAAGFLITGSYVSHVSGFGTQVGIALGHSEYDFGIELLTIPFAFIAGGILTSFILDRKSSKELIPNFPIVQMLITFLIGLIAALFSAGFFSDDRRANDNWRTLILIGLLCFVCGLKNAMTTWASRGKIRSTHLTGLATDVGLHLPKIFRPDGYDSRLPESKRVNHVRLMTLMSFSIGSGISALLMPVIGYKVFYLAFAISAGLTIFSIFHRRESLAEMANDVCEPELKGTSTQDSL